MPIDKNTLVKKISFAFGVGNVSEEFFGHFSAICAMAGVRLDQIYCANTVHKITKWPRRHLMIRAAIGVSDDMVVVKRLRISKELELMECVEFLKKKDQTEKETHKADLVWSVDPRVEMGDFRDDRAAIDPPHKIPGFLDDM